MELEPAGTTIASQSDGISWKIAFFFVLFLAVKNVAQPF